MHTAIEMNFGVPSFHKGRIQFNKIRIWDVWKNIKKSRSETDIELQYNEARNEVVVIVEKTC